MTSPVSAIEAIEKAMEGVAHAPGVWEADGTAVYCDDKTGQRVASTRGEYLFWTEEQKRANAAYIAACNPVAMREVLALARQAEALQRENAELREALKPFASVAPAFDNAVKPAPRNDDHEFYAWETMGGYVSITVGDFRRARTLLGGENAE